MKIQTTSLLLLVALMIAIHGQAQVSSSGSPVSFSLTKELMPIASIKSVTISDLSTLSSGGNNKAGINPELDKPSLGSLVEVDIDLSSIGTHEVLANGGKLWRLKLTSKGASALALTYDRFELPQGAQLFLYTEDKNQVLGAFTSKNNKESGKFLTGLTRGETVVLEYYEPSNVKSDGIHISRVGHIYRDLFNDSSGGNMAKTSSGVDSTAGFGDSESCMNNVNCPQGSGWCNQRRSVAWCFAVNQTQGKIAAFSGSLITNERRDLRPYFTTALHVIDWDDDGITSSTEMAETSDWFFSFNYQSAGCPNGLQPDVNAYTIEDASIVASSSKADFLLLELAERPPGEYNTFYNGWSNSKKKPKSGACIHHPFADIKKISSYEKKPKKKTKNGIKLWRVKWSDGKIQNGSSGGPLYNEDKRFVGQAKGIRSNPAICSKKQRGFFGRFDKAWDDSGTTRANLSPNSGKKSIEQMSGDDPCKTTYTFANASDLHTSANVDFFSNTDPFPGDRTYDGIYECTDRITASNNVTIVNGTSVEFNAGNLILLRPNFRAVEGCVFRARIEGCLNGCNTGVGKTTEETEEPMVYVIGTDDEEENLVEEYIDENSTISKDGYSIYPNPTSGSLTLNVERFSGSEVLIFNSLGELVHRAYLMDSETVFDLSSNAPGLYFLKVMSTERGFTEKIILE